MKKIIFLSSILVHFLNYSMETESNAIELIEQKKTGKFCFFNKNAQSLYLIVNDAQVIHLAPGKNQTCETTYPASIRVAESKFSEACWIQNGKLITQHTIIRKYSIKHAGNFEFQWEDNKLALYMLS